MSREDIAAGDPEIGDGPGAFAAGSAIRVTMRHARKGFWRPRTDSGTQQPRSVLDWYLEVG